MLTAVLYIVLATTVTVSAQTYSLGTVRWSTGSFTGCESGMWFASTPYCDYGCSGPYTTSTCNSGSPCFGNCGGSCVFGCTIYYCSCPNPTPAPTTSTPTPAPTNEPTIEPTPFPTSAPTSFPTAYPTVAPTSYPSWAPTSYPTAAPSLSSVATLSTTAWVIGIAAVWIGGTCVIFAVGLAVVAVIISIICCLKKCKNNKHCCCYVKDDIITVASVRVGEGIQMANVINPARRLSNTDVGNTVVIPTSSTAAAPCWL